MNEKEFAEKIRDRLQFATQQIDGITLNRLEQARQRALGKVRAAERPAAVASHRNGTLALHLGGGDGEHSHHTRMLFIGLSLLALLTGAFYWQQANDDDDEQGLLDAKMLSSELPLHAFVHPEFKEWVNSSR